MPIALVVGNSDGIGLAITNLLLDDGWHVTGISRSASLISVPCYRHHILDVCDKEYASKLSSIVAEMIGLAVCIYCAGIGEFLEVETLATDRRVFETNLMGAVKTLGIVIPAMIRNGRGHFVGLSSQADVLIDPKAPSYAASKAGLTSYLEGLAPACRQRGVYITNPRFGFVDTKMAKSPHRPFMIAPVTAARRIQHCLQRRPIRDTYPKRMAVLLWLLQLGSNVRRWLS
jgi:short-subunit dehydrogenase